MLFIILFSKGGDAFLYLLAFVFFLPITATRFTYFMWLKALISLGIYLRDRALEEWRLGYGLKLAIKIHCYVVKKLEEEEPMKGIRYDKPHDYVCKCDRKKPEKEQTRFKVRFLTAPEQAELRDMIYSVQGFGDKRNERFLSGTISLEALKIGLKGWENFTHEDGEEIPFTVDNFSCIPPAERDEIANYIRGVPEEEGV